jgi:hypothetical protein
MYIGVHHRASKNAEEEMKFAEDDLNSMRRHRQYFSQAEIRDAEIRFNEAEKIYKKEQEDEKKIKKRRLDAIAVLDEDEFEEKSPSPAEKKGKPEEKKKPEPAPVAQQIKASFECPVCLDILKQPVVTPCGHSFCGPCIKLLDKCPTCRAAIATPPARNFALVEEICRQYPERAKEIEYSHVPVPAPAPPAAAAPVAPPAPVVAPLPLPLPVPAPAPVEESADSALFRIGEEAKALKAREKDVIIKEIKRYAQAECKHMVDWGWHGKWDHGVQVLGKIYAPFLREALDEFVQEYNADHHDPRRVSYSFEFFLRKGVPTNRVKTVTFIRHPIVADRVVIVV